MVLRRATSADAEMLSRFAAHSFRETFGPDNDPSNMAAYLQDAYSPAIQAAEIGDSATTVILAVEEGATEGSLAGYAHLVTHDTETQLKRLYVDVPWKGQGLSRRLMDDVVAECRRRGAKRLWLTVWERNARAIAFYEKMGFRRSGTEVFWLGQDAQTDHVMEIDIPPSV